MPFGFEGNLVPTGGALDAAAFRELQKQNVDEIQGLRAHERIETRLTVVLQPADSRKIGQYELRGYTEDVSKGGCKATFPMPPAVGDVVRIRFDPPMGIPLVFARCLRCRLVREDAFEAGFRFFTEIRLPGSDDQSEDLLD